MTNFTFSLNGGSVKLREQNISFHNSHNNAAQFMVGDHEPSGNNVIDILMLSKPTDEKQMIDAVIENYD